MSMADARALVIGYGSIGARHARIVSELGYRTSVLSGRQVDFPVVYADLAEALRAENPSYVVIANATGQHFPTLNELSRLGYGGTVLIEKPLFERKLDIPESASFKAFVAYNLRFHPVIQHLKVLLQAEQILSVHAYVGQYLPDWRPGRDYRLSYSASAEQGGGVLRDLSHELDYLLWLLGGWESVAAQGGHFSSLEINSDDVFALMIQTPLCPVVTLQLNYLDRQVHRFLIVNTRDHTFEADLLQGTIRVDQEKISFAIGRDDTYGAMHRAAMAGGANDLCTLSEGLDTVHLIESCEIAARQGCWVAK